MRIMVLEALVFNLIIIHHYVFRRVFGFVTSCKLEAAT